MTSERLRRIIRSRWWVLALACLASLVAALLVTQLRNDAIPEWEASIAVTYNRLLGEVDDAAAQQRLSIAERLAVSVNVSDLSTGVDPLAPGVRAELIASESDQQLRFVGRGTTPEEASTVATTMRDRYLAAQSLDVSQEFAQRIADTAARLDEVLVAIALAAVPPGSIELETAARISELEAEVGAFASLYGQYTVELIEPRDRPRSREIILADRDAASDGLRTAQDELSNLRFAVGQATVHDDDVDLALLRAEEAQLRAALDNYIALRIIDEPIAVVSPVEVDLSGIAPTPLPVAVVIGLFVGLLIGMAGLVIVDRVRRPLWLSTELEPRYRLPEVAARPRSRGDSAKPWYGTAPEGQRKAGIQQLRSHVEGMPGFGDGLVVGLASLDRPSPRVHELAADLGAGLASSGSWALLIDADYSQPSDLPEYSSHDLELAHVVADPQGTIGEAAETADRNREFLGVSISQRSDDAADVLAQPAFAHMLDAAQALHDVVIVACPATDSASYHVLTQRLDAMILVAEAGDSRPEDVANTLRALEERRSVPAGVVLIRPRVGPVSLVMNQIDRPPPTPVPERVQEIEWQWSRRQDASRETVSSGAAYQAPRSAAPEPGAVGPHAGVRTEPDAEVASSSVVSAAAFPSHPSPEQSRAETGTTDPGIAEVASRRIKRRAFPLPIIRRGDGQNVDGKDASGSPWLFRQDEG